MVNCPIYMRWFRLIDIKIKMNCLLNAITCDVSEWVSAQKLTKVQVCAKFDLDVENDPLHRVLWNLHTSHRIVINDDVLESLGYPYETLYSVKKQVLTKALRKTNIDFMEMPDDSLNTYYVMDYADFVVLVGKLRTPEAKEARQLLSLMKYISQKYSEYQSLYQDKQLQDAIESLKIATETVDRHAEVERQRAAVREIRADGERKRAEEHERSSDERNRQLLQQLRYNTEILRERVMKKVTLLDM